MSMDRSVTAAFEPKDSIPDLPGPDEGDGNDSKSGGGGCFLSIHRDFSKIGEVQQKMIPEK
jgi:hypothetical protein